MSSVLSVRLVFCSSKKKKLVQAIITSWSSGRGVRILCDNYKTLLSGYIYTTRRGGSGKQGKYSTSSTLAPLPAGGLHDEDAEEP